ncbi:MAG: hypothetical protein AAGF23_25990 [Acidobacteriota bacterium]
MKRRIELGLPRHHFRWRYRLEQIEGTAKIARALRLLSLDGSREILDALGFTLDDLEAVAGERLDVEGALVRARRRRPTPAAESSTAEPAADDPEPGDD